MTVYKAGDIVLLKFPFSDQTTTKKRPAVIISSDVYHDFYEDIIVMAITSQIYNLNQPGKKIINNWKQSGLLKESAIKAAVSTIEKNLVIKKIGQLMGEDVVALKESIEEIVFKY